MAQVLQVYEQARTAHFERLADLDAELIYRTESYDHDVFLAEQGASRKRGRMVAFFAILNTRAPTVELNEPAMISAWFSIFLYRCALSLRRLLGRSAVRVVAYAIETYDPCEKMTDRAPWARSITRPIVKAFFKRLSSGYDRIAFGTESASGMYHALGLSGRVDTRTFDPLSPVCPQCTFADKFGAVFVGSLENRKGIPLLLSAWAGHLADSGYRLSVLGQGPLEQEVIRASKRNLSIRYASSPSREDIHLALARSSVLVLLSQRTGRWREQVGLPILEALSHGCHVVTTTETGLSEWLRNNGHTVLAPSASPQEVALAIGAALKNPRAPSEIIAGLPETDGRLRAHRWMMAD